MMNKAFSVATNLTVDDTLGRLTRLFEAGGVTLTRDNNALRSVRTPVPLVNVDPRLYSRRNWVGINPFALVTSVEASMTASGGGTLIDVSIDRRRLVLLLVFEVLIVLSIATRAPVEATIAITLIMPGLCLLLLRWSHTLLRQEIEREMKS
jgi:hypothetical protein